MNGNAQYGWGFQREDFGPSLITAGLSMLANNDGRSNAVQLIGQGGLDALAGLQARKQYEAAMEKQRREAEANKWHMDTTNGYMIDKSTGAATPIAGWKPKPSSDMERYLAMTPEERAKWHAYKLAVASAGSTRINNNMGRGFESSFSKNEGERASKYLGQLEDDYLAAGKKIADYDALDRLFENGLKTGVTEDFKNDVAKAIMALGFKQKDLDAWGFQNVANVEGFKSLQARATMDALLDQKGVQTEGDSQRAAQTWASIGNTSEGNKWINQYARNIANRERERAKFLRSEMRKNGNDIMAADEAWEEHLKTLPSVVPDASTAMKPESSAGQNNAPKTRIQYDANGNRVIK